MDKHKLITIILICLLCFRFVLCNNLLEQSGCCLIRLLIIRVSLVILISIVNLLNYDQIFTNQLANFLQTMTQINTRSAYQLRGLLFISNQITGNIPGNINKLINFINIDIFYCYRSIFLNEMFLQILLHKLYGSFILLLFGNHIQEAG